MTSGDGAASRECRYAAGLPRELPPRSWGSHRPLRVRRTPAPVPRAELAARQAAHAGRLCAKLIDRLL